MTSESSRSARGRIAVLTVALLVGATACGGGDENYSAEATGDCLAEDVVVKTSEEELDYVAAEAGEGALEAELDENTVTIAFERTSSDAEDTEASYRVFIDAFGGSSDGKLERKGNAVLLWEKTPTDAERKFVDDCLRSE